MKIKCLNIVSDTTGENSGNETVYLKVGNIYVVLEIEIDISTANKLVWFRFFGEDNETTVLHLYNGKNFELVDGEIPSNWGISFEKNFGGITIAPKRWLDNSLWENSFWEDYFDDSLEAIKCFEEEKAIIYAEANTPLGYTYEPPGTAEAWLHQYRKMQSEK